jgi:hypothetical protein
MNSFALPTFSRQYGVPCQTCHTVAPHLNSTGLAFQANYFRWFSQGAPSKPKGLLAQIPISGLTTFSGSENRSLDLTSREDFQTQELFLAAAFPDYRGRASGGYFVDWLTVNRNGRAGDLADAWMAYPVAGNSGQLAVTAGQFSPMLFQYDPNNSLTQSLPLGLDVDADAFSFLDPTPGLRLDWFDHRGQGTADGNYLSVGLPFGGHLTLDKESRVYGSDGVFVHGFRRSQNVSVGGFGYSRNGGTHLEGLLSTYDPLPKLSFLVATASGHDSLGDRRGFSLEADYSPLPILALTGRLESIHGDQNATFPVAAITYYPFGQEAVRFTGETVQQPGQRTVALYAFLQF